MDEQGDDVIALYCSRLERDEGVNLHRASLKAALTGGVLALEGEVYDIAAKRRAVALAEQMFGVGCVDDRLAVTPAQKREDGEVRDSLMQSLLNEPVFRRFGVKLWCKDEMQVMREVVRDAEGHLDVIVDDSVITLAGEVWSLSHRRFAELLAWWTPGARQVVNRIEIRPPEADNDDEISDAVRLALDKDPLVHSEQIRITTRNRVVRLEGLVREPEERQMAEEDVWYLGGAAGVENRIQVQRNMAPSA